ncbi:MAG: AAA family ATPase [Saccharofermentans sp.]|nr:AAA family ATPase [Saccharofermentans sp.]
MTKVELKLNKLEEVELEDVNWLWYPYIPFGKITVIQGDPAQGKTHLLLKIAAQCTTGDAFPDTKSFEPFNVIYQTAEDGLGDTIKPRLIMSGADQSRIVNIDEDELPLNVLDERVEEAIIRTGAKLIIFDPIQAYMGKIDINSAIEVREILGKLARMAEKHDCAVILIGHLNKRETVNSSTRGMGSMDIRACARSVLLVGRLKDDPNVRIIVHDKSSLAPEGASVAFELDKSKGFTWVDGYEDVAAIDILSVPTKTKKDNSQVMRALERLKVLFADRTTKIPATELYEILAKDGIDETAAKRAKNLIPGLESKKIGSEWIWMFPAEERKEECNSDTDDLPIEI